MYNYASNLPWDELLLKENVLDGYFIPLAIVYI